MHSTPTSEPAAPATQATTYLVQDMSCGHCTAAVTDAALAVPGVRSAHADLDTKLLEVRGTEVTDQAILAAVGGAGYQASRA